MAAGVWSAPRRATSARDPKIERPARPRPPLGKLRRSKLGGREGAAWKALTKLGYFYHDSPGVIDHVRPLGHQAAEQRSLSGWLCSRVEVCVCAPMSSPALP